MWVGYKWRNMFSVKGQERKVKLTKHKCRVFSFISFLSLLQPIITVWASLNNTHVYYYSSWGQKSKMALSRTRSSWRAVSLREDILMLRQLLKVTPFPLLLASFLHFQSQNFWIELLPCCHMSGLSFLLSSSFLRVLVVRFDLCE